MKPDTMLEGLLTAQLEIRNASLNTFHEDSHGNRIKDSDYYINELDTIDSMLNDLISYRRHQLREDYNE